MVDFRVLKYHKISDSSFSKIKSQSTCDINRFLNLLSIFKMTGGERNIVVIVGVLGLVER